VGCRSVIQCACVSVVKIATEWLTLDLQCRSEMACTKLLRKRHMSCLMVSYVHRESVTGLVWTIFPVMHSLAECTSLPSAEG
jgi:hypothetical protein